MLAMFLVHIFSSSNIPLYGKKLKSVKKILAILIGYVHTPNTI